MYQVVLGLGSNMGQKLHYLRQAVMLIAQELGEIKKFSPIYQTKALLPNNAPSNWDIDYYNVAVLVSTTLSPERLLDSIKRIEIQLGRDPNHAFWSPREIDIDILCYDDLVYQSERLQIPHRYLLERNFALQPLLDVWSNWCYSERAINLYARLKTMPALTMAPFTLSGSQIMAIVNLSADSFSTHAEGVVAIEQFTQYIVNLVNLGAEVIDLGAESTKPNAIAKSAENHWQTLMPYLEIVNELVKTKILPLHLQVSIDTYHAGVVEKALAYECVTMINDVYGIEEQEIAKLLSNKPIAYVFMHQLGKAGTEYLSPDRDPVEELISYGQGKITKLLGYGLKREQLIFDMGIGFGKYPYQAQHLLQHVEKIKASLGISLLVGHSRKASVMPCVIGANNDLKDLATAMITRSLIHKNIDYIRVHNVSFARVAKQLPFM